MIANKVLKNFNLDLSDLPASAETREFSIIGDEGLEFLKRHRKNILKDQAKR